MQIIDGIPVFGFSPDEGALVQARRCKEMKETAHVTLMADHHKGYGVPIGGVVAYRDHVSPSGVGYDIGCGNKAVLTNMRGPEARKFIREIMNDIWRNISFGIGRKNAAETVDHPLFDSPTWKLRAVKDLKQMAQGQLGTIGSGNHYVDIFTDEMDRVWVGVHFGSRGLGHKTATFFLNEVGAKDNMDAPPVVLPARASIGEDYIECMKLAGEYAYAGRDWVCSYVAKNILGADILDEVHNHHNFAWQETHDLQYGPEKLWVVRKGATPARPGQRGFVGGSMGENSVILEGVGPESSTDISYGLEIMPKQELALFSTVHGAGRVMGRMEAKGKTKVINGVTTVLRPGKVTQDMMDRWMTGIELRGAGLDESPDCYKRLPEVLSDQGGTVRILHTLKPIGVAMAGKDEYDPFKD